MDDRKIPPEMTRRAEAVADRRPCAPPVPPPVGRRERALYLLDLSAGHGLEIGPLDKPLVPKGQADVGYVDIMPAEDLRAHYGAHPQFPVELIGEVDYPLILDGKTRSISESTGPGAPFDWVVASHVIEHVPDAVGWLRDIATILADGAKLSLIIPDRRYSFDARRPETTVGELLLANESHDVRPSTRAIFDHYANAVAVVPEVAWREGVPDVDKHIHDIHFARSMALRSRRLGEYVDSHVWLFTPTSFVEQMQILASLGMFDYSIDNVIPTDVDDVEFFVTLTRLPRTLTRTERADAIRSGFPRPVDNELPLALPEDDHEPAPTGLSEREQQFIRLQRSTAKRIRSLRR
jgi:SAM-dependent methyltransferase